MGVPGPLTAQGPRTPEELAAARRLLAGAGDRPALNRLAHLATRLLGSASAQVSLLTDVQTVAAGAGLPPEALGAASPLPDSLCTVTTAIGAALVVPDAANDPRVAHLPPVASGAVGAYLGVPLMSDAGYAVGAFCVYGADPRAWTDADVALMQELGGWAVAELERAALTADQETSQARWELAVSAAEIGSFDWDLITGRLHWDDRLVALFGYHRAGFDETFARFAERLHPDDLPRVERALQAAIDTVGVYDEEYRVLLPGGDARWLRARGRVLADDDGRPVRMLGSAFDMTREREGEARLTRLLESMSAAFISLDRDWNLTYVNGEAERILGMDRHELLGHSHWELFPAVTGTELETAYRGVMETGEPATIENYYPDPLNIWFEVRVYATPDGISLNFLDVTARHAAQELADLSTRAGEQLTRSLDVEDGVRDLAQLVVPRLADWSVVTVLEAGGTLRDLAAWHVDPEERGTLERYVEARLDSLQAGGPVGEASRQGTTVITPSGATANGRRLLRPGVARDAFTELAPESTVILPLASEGRVFGALTLCRGADRPPMSDPELTAAAGIADRAALALENSRLYAQQRTTAQRLREVARHERTVARALQEAMLTRLPAAEPLTLAARYLTASAEEQVGGDWYDAVTLPGGETALMIGDVVGHDIRAAAVMGQLRNMLRTLIWDHDEEAPSATVARLDRAMHDLGLETFATLVLLRVSPPADGSDGAWGLLWTTAGHPPPLLIAADGATTVLHQRTDPLLGFAADTRRADHARTAPPGSTLLLYTDGLVEARRDGATSGESRLEAALHAHRDLTLEPLLDAVLADMVGEHPADDVALLAVRFPA
jgi:PAS domain S-box-containing protein